MRNQALYPKDILEAMKNIRDFVKDMDFEEFKEDDKTSSAVIRKFEIIGEAAKRVPEEIKRKYARIPWKEMAGMRDVLIHSYFGVDYKLVWRTIEERLPKLILLFEEIAK